MSISRGSYILPGRLSNPDMAGRPALLQRDRDDLEVLVTRIRQLMRHLARDELHVTRFDRGHLLVSDRESNGPGHDRHDDDVVGMGVRRLGGAWLEMHARHG